MIPPGVIPGLAGAAVGLIRSLLRQPQRKIDASGADWNARCARDCRLKVSGVSTHEIARRLGMARSTVRETLKRADGAGLAWPLPEDMNDEALEGALYASRRSKRGHRRIAEPDWADVHRELNADVPLLILWDEYIAANPGGYSYSRFCELYRSFEKTLSVTMRQTHAAGERLFVDYAGDGVPVVVDRLTGEIRMAQIFVAVLGASGFTFAKATWTQALPDWIDAHVRAFEAIGGVPELVVPDNPKTAIVKASFYDPEVNRTYAEMAAHYRTVILPARPRKPRDKAKVEQAVLIVERWLLGRLRRRVFHSLADVDVALGEFMIQLNERQPLRRLGLTRRQLLEEIDRPALGPCRMSLTNTASGACLGSASTITSRSTLTIILSPIASPAPRSRRG